MAIYYPATPFVPVFTDDDGTPLSGGKLIAYLRGTSTQTPVYSDTSGTSLGATVTLNARGEPQTSGKATCIIHLDSSISYKFELQNASASQKWALDSIQSSSVAHLITKRVNTLAALQALTTSNYSAGDTVFMASRTSANDGGHGEFTWTTGDQSSNVAADEVGSGLGDGGIWVATSSDKTGASGAWKRNVHQNEINPRWYGAIGDNSTDATTAFQKSLDYCANNGGGLVLVPEGIFKITSTLTIAPNTTLQGLSKRGSIIASYVTGTTAAIFLDGASVSGNAHVKFSTFSLISYVNDGYGFSIVNSAFLYFEDISTENLLKHYDIIDTVSCTWSACGSRFGPTGAIGLHARAGSGVSNPNAFTFLGSSFGSLSGIGILCDDPATFTFVGGSIEACGSGIDGGVILNNPGGQGAAAFAFYGTYFEGNGGGADLKVVINGNTDPCVGIVSGCTFNRTSNITYTTNNIQLAQISASDGYCSISVLSCGFQSFNTYVPSASRPYIKAAAAGKFRIVEDGNLYADAVEAPTVVTSGVTYSSSIDVDAAVFPRAGGTAVVTITDGNAFTINAPTNAVVGQEITFTLRNTSGGAAGVATWNSGASGYRLGAAWTQPANGFSRSIIFYYAPNGLWIEKSRTTVDVSN